MVLPSSLDAGGACSNQWTLAFCPAAAVLTPVAQAQLSRSPRRPTVPPRSPSQLVARRCSRTWGSNPFSLGNGMGCVGRRLRPVGHRRGLSSSRSAGRRARSTPVAAGSRCCLPPTDSDSSIAADNPIFTGEGKDRISPYVWPGTSSTFEQSGSQIVDISYPTGRLGRSCLHLAGIWRGT